LAGIPLAVKDNVRGRHADHVRVEILGH
jgi:hypothetical protein